MNPKELVYEAINHRETEFLPYTIEFESETIEKYKEYYEIWNKKIKNHILRVAPIDPEKRQMINEKYVKDIYGSIWRIDLKPMHLEKPALTEPDFKNYNFPKIDEFIDNERMQEVERVINENKDKFIVASFGFGLFERTWTICGFENALMWSITEPDFYEELLDNILKLQSDFIDICLKFGVDGIMFSDDWGIKEELFLDQKDGENLLNQGLQNCMKRLKKLESLF